MTGMNDNPQSIAAFIVERLQAAHPQHAQVNFVELLEGVTEVYETHGQFVAAFLKAEFDFVFDAKTGLYLTRFSGVRHVNLQAALYRYWGGKPLDLYEAADAFVHEGLGMLKSRASHRIYRGATFQVPTELRRVARDIEVL